MQDISIPYKDDRTYTITLSNTGAPNASGWKIYFNVKEQITDTDEQSVIAKVIDFDEAPNDANAFKGYLIFTTEDTAIDARKYAWNLRVVDNNGKKQSSQVGVFEITKVVNQDGS